MINHTLYDSFLCLSFCKKWNIFTSNIKMSNNFFMNNVIKLLEVVIHKPRGVNVPLALYDFSCSRKALENLW